MAAVWVCVVYLVQNWDSYSDVGECLNLLECSRRRFGGAEEDGGKNIFRNVGIHTDMYGDTS